MAEKWYNVNNIEIVEAELTSKDGFEDAIKTENLVLSTSILKKALKQYGIKIFLFDDITKRSVQSEFARDYVNFAKQIIEGQSIINAKDDGKPDWVK